MKKHLKFLMILPLVLVISACNLNFYDSSDKETTQTGFTGQNNVIVATNYTGHINYASNTQIAYSKETVYSRGVTSTVYILASQTDSAVLGSGVFFSEDAGADGYAYIFTNAHVVREASTLEIIYSNHKRDRANLVGYNVLEDVAVLKVKKNDNYTIPTVKTTDKLSIASEVLTIGTPASTEYSFVATSGIISKIDSPLTSSFDSNYNLLLLQIDATLNSGNSGGPTFDMYGNLIGLNTVKLLYDSSYNQLDDFNFAVPIERAIFIANTFFNNTPYERGLLGITIQDITDMSVYDRETKEITLNYGLYIMEVSPTGASNNILLSNDIIVEIDDTTFTTKTQFQKILYNHFKDDIINLKVYRNGEYLNLNVTLK